MNVNMDNQDTSIQVTSASTRIGKWPIIIFLCVLLAWVACLCLGVAFLSGWEKRGQFGDLFGSVNALFSGLAFAALIITIFLQRKELELQRDELRLQREEMEKSRQVLTEQARSQMRQNLAAIYQLKATASEARIEAIKIESLSVSEAFRRPYAERIYTEAKYIDSLVKELSQTDLENYPHRERQL